MDSIQSSPFLSLGMVSVIPILTNFLTECTLFQKDKKAEILCKELPDENVIIKNRLWSKNMGKSDVGRFFANEDRRPAAERDGNGRTEHGKNQ